MILVHYDYCNSNYHTTTCSYIPHSVFSNVKLLAVAQKRVVTHHSTKEGGGGGGGLRP